MKRIASVLLLAILFLPLGAQVQKRIYTRSYMLQDFKSKTTKVVLGGDAALNASLRQDHITLRILHTRRIRKAEKQPRMLLAPPGDRQGHRFPDPREGWQGR